VNKNSDKIDEVISSKRVKLHLFEPSQRKIWSVVGKSKEHWLDPNIGFCSCQAFYFDTKNEHVACYHLDSVTRAVNEDKVEIIIFSDDEFEDFVDGLITDL